MIDYSLGSTPILAPSPLVESNARMDRLGLQMRANTGFAESVALETWRSLSESEQHQRLGSQEEARDVEMLARQELFQFETEELGFFLQLNEYDRQNMQWVLMSEQLTPDERQAYFDQGMLPYVLNRMRRNALTTLGEFMSQDTESRAKARTPSNERFAQAVNILFQYFDRVNRWKMQKHLVVQDAMVGSRGVAGCRYDVNDPFGSIRKERYRKEEFMWHTRTAEGPRLERTKYFERIYYKQRSQMIVEFPEYAANIRNFTPEMWGGMQQHVASVDLMITPRVQAPTGAVANTYVHSGVAHASWRDAIVVREFYRRRTVPKWQVVDPYRGKFANCDSRDQANAWNESTYKYWKAYFALQGYPDFEVKLADPRLVNPETLDKLTWAGNMLLRIESAGESIPYHVCCPEMFDGSITSWMGHGKDGQRLENRFTSRMDQFGGAAKGKTVVNINGLPQEFTQEDVNQNLASDTEALLLNVPLGTPLSDVIYNVAPPGIGPAAQMLYNVALSSEQQMYGGQNYIGQQESANESGRAVLARQTAASLALIPYVQEVHDFDESVSRQELQLIQNLDPGVLRAILRQADPGMQEDIVEAFLEAGVQSLEEIDLDVEVVEVNASASTKDRISSNLAYLSGQSPQMAKYIIPFQLKYMDVDDSIREGITQNMQEDQDFERKLQASEMEHKQDMERKAEDRKHLELLIKLKELEIKANPPMQTTANIKMDATSPSIIAGILTRGAGIPADPHMVAADIALGAFMDQGKRDMQQIHRNDNLLPAEIKALEHKSKQPYKNVPSVEDSEARTTK